MPVDLNFDFYHDISDGCMKQEDNIKDVNSCHGLVISSNISKYLTSIKSQVDY